MAIETLYADAHLTGTFTNPGNAVGNTPATWAGDLNVNSNYTSRWSLADPVNALTPAATHTVRVWARKGINSGTPTLNINLWQAGVLVSSTGLQNVTSTTGQLISTTFTTSEMVPGAGAEIEVIQTSVGGNPSTRNSAQVAYIEWLADTSPPVAPTTAPSLTLDAVGETTVDLSWSVVESADTYELQRDLVTIQNTSARTLNDSGLTANTSYDYQVRAVNSAGSGPWSNVLEVTTFGPPTQTPTLSASAVGQTTATINASEFIDDGKHDTIEFQRDLLTVQNLAQATLNDSGLIADTSYDYRVRLVNTYGSGPWSTTLTITTAAPPTLPFLNTFEGGVHGQNLGSTASLADSGGASGNKFDGIFRNSGATQTFDNERVRPGSTMSIKHFSDTGASARIFWDQTSIPGTPLDRITGRWYINIGIWGGAQRIVFIRDTAATLIAGIGMFTDRRVVIRDINGTAVAQAGTPLPLGQWVRIEWLFDRISGYAEARTYFDPEAPLDKPSERLTAAGLAWPNGFARMEFGTASVGTSIWGDDYGLGTAWLGPTQPPGGSPPVAVATVSDDSVVYGTTVTLDASGSSGVANYEWRQVGGPTLSVTDPTSAITTTTIEEDTNYRASPEQAQPTANQIYTKLPEAWAITKGSEQTRLAVIDSGFINTPDMPESMYLRNEGWNVAYNTPDTSEWGGDDLGVERHGTYTAAVANANGAYNYWGSRRAGRVIPIRSHRAATDISPSRNTYTVAQGIIYAADVKADVVSISLTPEAFVHDFDVAVRYGFDHGLAIFASAGNDAAPAENFSPLPSHKLVTGVASTDPGTDVLNPNSNWNVEIAAPTSQPVSNADPFQPDPPNYGTSTANLGGTSAACPFAAGIAALCHANNRRATNRQIQHALYTTARPIGQNITHGHVVADAAVTAMLNYTSIDVGRPVTSFTDIGGHANEAAIETLEWYEFFSRLGYGTTFSPDTAITRGNYALALEHLTRRLHLTQLNIPPAPFTDLQLGPLADAAHRLVDSGFIAGVGPETFEPAGGTTRRLMITELANIVEAVRGSRLTATGTNYFTDVAPSDPGAADIDAFAEHGLLISGGAFNPTSLVTRGFFAQVVRNVFNYWQWTKPLVAEDALPIYRFQLTVTSADGQTSTDEVSVETVHASGSSFPFSVWDGQQWEATDVIIDGAIIGVEIAS